MHGWARASRKHLRLPRQPGVERRSMRPPSVPRRYARCVPQLQEGDRRSAEVQERNDRALAELREDREGLPRGHSRQISELPENPEALPLWHERQAAAVLSDHSEMPLRYGWPAAELHAQTAEIGAPAAVPELPEVQETELRPRTSRAPERRSAPALRRTIEGQARPGPLLATLIGL
jgi:hypothetical protein